jgi:hypothetical protein
MRRLFGAISLMLAATPAAGQDTLRVTVRVGNGPVSGRVTSSISTQAIPFVLLSLDRPRLDFFSSEQGRFGLPALSRGEHRLLVRQLGYQPLEVLLVVAESAPGVLDLVLEPKALVLPTLVASACVSVPDLDPGARAILNAAAENARRLVLMQRDYRTPALQQVRRSPSRETADQVPSRRERFGAVVISTRRAIVPGARGMVDVAYFSATALLADRFRKSHCFRFGGVDSTDPAAPTLTLEFEPLASLKGPDWEGKLTLDERGVLRSSEANLVARKPKENWPTSAWCQVTYEAVAGTLPMESSWYAGSGWGRLSPSETVEEWRLEFSGSSKVPGLESGLLPDSSGVWRGKLCR